MMESLFIMMKKRKHHILSMQMEKESMYQYNQNDVEYLIVSTGFVILKIYFTITKLFAIKNKTR